MEVLIEGSISGVLFLPSMSTLAHITHTSICPSSNTGVDWPHQIPSFIGNNYFCDSGLASAQYLSTVYDSDPLWDGKGCGATSTCCQFNKPPWFYANLPGATSDDLELRICQDESSQNENMIVAYIELSMSN